MRKSFAPLSVLALLAGCAGNYAYVEPVDTPSATLEFVNNTNGAVIGPFMYADPVQCSDRKFPNMIGKEKNRSVKVKADQQTVVGVMMPESTGSNVLVGGFGALGLLVSDSMYKDCKPIVDFVPKADHRYVMTMIKSEKGCEYNFKALTPAGEPDAGFQFKQRKFSRPWGESGPWCE